MALISTMIQNILIFQALELATLLYPNYLQLNLSRN